MKQHFKKFFIFYIILVLSLSFTPIFLSKDIQLESGISCLLDAGNIQRCIVKGSNDTLYCIYVNETAGAGCFVYSYSINNGSTWNKQTIFVGLPTNFQLGIDANNDLHIVYVNTTNAIKYVKRSSGDWQGWTALDTPAGATAINYVSMCIDPNNNINVVYNYVAGAVTSNYYVRYNANLGTWGNYVTLNSNPTTAQSICCDTDGNVFYYYIIAQETGVYNMRLMLRFASIGNWSEYRTITERINYVSGQMVSAMQGETIYIVYENTHYFLGGGASASSINITYSYNHGTTYADKTVFDAYGYHNRYPTLSINSDGSANIVWSGASAESSNIQLKYRKLSGTSLSDIEYLSIGNTDHSRPVLMYQNYPTTCRISNGFLGLYLNDTGATDNIFYFDSDGFTFNVSTGGTTVTEWYCTGGNFYGDKYINAKYLEINEGWYLNGYNLTSFKIKLQDYQYLTYSNLSYYTAFAVGMDLGNPARWEYIDNNYYWLIWESFTVTLTGNFPSIEIQNLYENWYYCAVEYPTTLSFHSDDSLYRNGIYTDGTFLNHRASVCFGFGEYKPTYNITFTCIYNNVNCMQYNNYLSIITHINIFSGIYYILYNASGVNIYEGSWSTGYDFYNTIWIDQNYGIGTYTFSVYPTRYKNSGWEYATNYSICLTWGTNRSNIVYTDKKTYYEGDEVNIFWNAPFGESDYIVIHDSSTIEDATICYNTSVSGIGILQEIIGAWTSKITDIGSDFQTFYLYMLNASTGKKIPNVEYIFQVRKGIEGVTLNIAKDTIQQYETQTISGKHPFTSGDYSNAPFLKIMSNGVWIETFDAPKDFNFEYQCQEIGKYTVTLVVSGHDYISRTWEVIPKENENPLLPKIDTQMGYIVGIIIIVAFLLMPMLISLSYGKSPADVPAIVYAISGGIGIGITVLLGLVPLWIPFFIIVIGILITVLIWLRGSSSG